MGTVLIQVLSFAAEALNVSGHTANDAVPTEGRRVLTEDPTRFDGVRVVGVDKHVGRHSRRGDNYVTVVIDLTPVRDHTGTARLLDSAKRAPAHEIRHDLPGVCCLLAEGDREPVRARAYWLDRDGLIRPGFCSD